MDRILLVVETNGAALCETGRRKWAVLFTLVTAVTPEIQERTKNKDDKGKQF